MRLIQWHILRPAVYLASVCRLCHIESNYFNRNEFNLLFLKFTEWPLVVGEAWARYGKSNVLFVDYRKHAMTFYTNTVAKEIHLVAATVLVMLEKIRMARGTHPDGENPASFY